MALHDDELTDDYVASLLKRDAERGSNRLKYSDLHTGTTRPRNRATPNTRFFRHIIRETDSHNAALKKKEEDEARERQRRLKRRHRQEEERGDGRERKRRRSREGKRGRDGSEERSHRRGHDRDRHGRLKSRSRSRSRSKERRRETERDRDRRPRRTHESYDDFQEKDHDHRSRRRSRDRERRRTRSPRARSRETEHVSREKEPRDRNEMPRAQDHNVDEEDLIGPRPPPRGRGAQFSGMGSIDARFQPGYNPQLDVALDDPHEDDDWASSLEALRARTQWRHNGAERLRAAGFSEDQVQTWQNGSSTREKDPEQVKWTKKGESREWDRGKVLDGDHIDLRASWTRGGTL